jgi:23S rRNA (uracil1939-C5)-methyltransferase
MNGTIVIERLGQRGDGLAAGPAGVIAVPGALPGETVSVTQDGETVRLASLVTRSEARREPFCPYYGRCGGCVAQHMSPELQSDWKRGLVQDTLSRAGIEIEVPLPVDAHGEGRRRVTLHLRWQDGAGWIAGFMAARSHDLVPISTCPVLAPELARQAPTVAIAVATATGARNKPLDMAIVQSKAGLDVDIRGLGAPGEGLRQRLFAVAAALDLARLSVHGELIVERRAPVQPIAGLDVVPAPGAFLQATAEGERLIGAEVARILAGRKKVADLFCGCGPIALALGRQSRVDAFDSEAGAIAALDRTVRHAAGLKPVTAQRRDLFRRPLLADELKPYDGLSLDPPRAGALAQAQEIARTRHDLTLAMVSCDAGSFARDTRILLDAGFRLTSLLVIDQFRHSPHVEIVAGLQRGGRKG